MALRESSEELPIRLREKIVIEEYRFREIRIFLNK